MNGKTLLIKAAGGEGAEASKICINTSLFHTQRMSIHLEKNAPRADLRQRLHHSTEERRREQDTKAEHKCNMAR